MLTQQLQTDLKHYINYVGKYSATSVLFAILNLMYCLVFHTLLQRNLSLDYSNQSEVP